MVSMVRHKVTPGFGSVNWVYRQKWRMQCHGSYGTFPASCCSFRCGIFRMSAVACRLAAQASS